MTPKQRAILLIVFSASMSLGVILNSLCCESRFLGIVFTVLFFASMGLVCGKVLFDDEPLFLKAVKGWFVYVVLLTVLGTLILLLDRFDIIFSTLSIVPVAALFWVLLARKTRSSFDSTPSDSNRKSVSMRKSQVALSILAAAFCIVAFYTLWLSRTSEPMFDVWQTIPTWFFLIVITSSLFLCGLLLSKRNSWVPLVLVMLQGFLFESVYYLVWYPSTYGDPLTNLGKARFVLDTGQVYARSYLVSNGLWMDLLKGRGYSTLITQLARMLNYDIYWVHNIVIPLLWAIVIPISLYEITCLMVKKPLHKYPRAALLAAFSGAFLIRPLIAWGAAPTPNTLAFIMLFFSMPILLRWLQTGKSLSLGLVIMTLVATAFSHPFPGVVGGVFLLIASFFRFVKNGFLRGVLISVSALVYPILLGYDGGFTPERMLNLQSFLDFEVAVLTIPLLVAVVGLFFLYHRRRDIDSRIAVFLPLMWVVVVFDYYVSEYGVRSLQYGAGRILTIADFLLTPFVGLGLSLIVISIGKVGHSSPLQTSTKVRSGFFGLRSLAIVLLCLIMAMQSLATLYQAYPLNEVKLAPTAYEAEAIYYINSTAVRPFAVVSDTLFTNLAIGLLGEGYSYGEAQSGGIFGIPEWNYYLQDIYLKMTKKPSLTFLKSVHDTLNVTQVYFVLSVRLDNFREVLIELSELLPVDKTFGEGKLYLFSYMPVPMEGSGPEVSVTFEDGTTTEVQSRFQFEIKEEVKYNITLTGHSSYNITNYPQYWVFSSLDVNQRTSKFDNSSDVNSFILKSGLNPNDVLEITWVANELYRRIGWKEDSFRSGWSSYPGWSYPVEPAMEFDGNMLALFWNFTPGRDENHYYSKAVSISTDDYPYVMVRWASSAPVAVVGVYFDVGFQAIVPFGSSSSGWATTIVELPPGKNIAYVMVGIADYRYLTEPTSARVFVDYVLLVNKG